MCVNVSLLGLYKKSSPGKQNKKQTKKRDTSEAGEGGHRDPQESIMEATRLCSMINEDSVLRNETVPASCVWGSMHIALEKTQGALSTFLLCLQGGDLSGEGAFFRRGSWSNHG